MFDDFFPTSGSTRARRLCRAVAEGRASASRALILEGPTGSGKSHLVGATARAYAERNPASAVRIASAEAVASELLTAIRSDRFDSLRQRLAGISLFIIEDLHVLGGKPGTQEGIARELKRGLPVDAHVLATATNASQLMPFRQALGAVRTSVVAAPTIREMKRIIEMMADRRGFSVPRTSMRSIVRWARGDVRRAIGAVNRIAFSRARGQK